MELSPRESPDHNPRVEEYLSRVLRQLPGAMSPACRVEHRNELAAHLEALIAAQVELGSDEEAAVLVALQRFGCAEDLGRRLSRQWKSSARSGASAPELASAAVAFLGGLFLGGMLLCPLYPEWPSAGLGPESVGRCLDLLVPCLVGYYWGSRRTSEPRSLGIVLMAGLLTCSLLPLQQDYQGMPGLDLFARGFHLMQWMILGCSTAGLTSALRVIGERWRKRSAV